MVYMPEVEGAVQRPVGVMVPPVAVQVSVLVTPPVAVAVKMVVVATVRVGVAGERGPTATACGVTVTEASAAPPAAFVDRSQKVCGAVMAAVLRATPETGLTERSFAPRAEPTMAETAPVKVVTSATGAPKSGVVVEAVMDAVGPATTVRLRTAGWLDPPVLVAVM